MPLTLKAFLSHRYQSPAVNTYFHEIFSEVAEVQFDVDRGTGATNVTRLERMIRDTDAFVGIYPYSGADGDRPTRQQLLEASRYFRLELDLATRACTPSIVFVDRRYGPVIAPPTSMFVSTFDHLEVTGRGGSPNRTAFQQRFRQFAENVTASMQYERTRPSGAPRQVGLVLPSSYDTALVDAVEGVVQAANVETRRLAWPPRLDGRTIDWLQSCDFVVADVGPAGQSTGLAAYLHGQFIPTLRLRSTSGDPVASSSLEDALYGAYEVGFPKDVVRWSSRDDLLPEIARRLDRILQEGRRIGSTPEARAYFQEAALRKEAVFLSYSGRDEDLVAPIAAALRRRFQSVFDYRDGGDSIEPGRPWMDEIFSKLDRAALAVLALSPTYLASGNCAHEARSAVAAHDGGKVALLPIKLRRDDVLELPPFLTDVQYVRAWEQTGPDAIVDRIVNAVEKQAV